MPFEKQMEELERHRQNALMGSGAVSIVVFLSRERVTDHPVSPSFPVARIPVSRPEGGEWP